MLQGLQHIAGGGNSERRRPGLEAKMPGVDIAAARREDRGRPDGCRGRRGRQLSDRPAGLRLPLRPRRRRPHR